MKRLLSLILFFGSIPVLLNAQSLSVGTKQANVGDNICLDLKTEDISTMLTAQFTIDYFAEHLAKFIRPCNMQSINISLGPCGSLSITAKFDGSLDLKNFESKTKPVFDDIKTSFDFIQTNYSGVYIYTFEAENAATEITLN